jgi:hypothetical protein
MLVSVVVLSGCSSVATNPETGALVPVANVVDQELLTSGPDKGEVIVARDKAFMASAVDTRVFVDGKRVANIPNATVLKFYLPAGEHKIGVQLYGFNESEVPVRYEKLHVAPAGTYRYRLVFNSWTWELMSLD